LLGLYPITWKQRFRYIWQIITKGFPYTDMVCLSPEKAKQLADFINKKLEENESESQSN
jgi:hypothetical protein